MLHNLTITLLNSMFTLRSAVNLSNMFACSNNCLTVYISKFHTDVYEHSFAIRVANYCNVLYNNIVLSPNSVFGPPA